MAYIRSIDFVLPYLQVDIKTDIYTRQPSLPAGFQISELSTFTDHFTSVYQLITNLYSLKDIGKTWNDYLKFGLIKRG